MTQIKCIYKALFTSADDHVTSPGGTLGLFPGHVAIDVRHFLNWLQTRDETVMKISHHDYSEQK